MQDPNIILQKKLKVALEKEQDPGFMNAQCEVVCELLCAALEIVPEEDLAGLMNGIREQLQFSIFINGEDEYMKSYEKAAQEYTKNRQDRNAPFLFEYSNRIGEHLYFSIVKNKKEGLRAPNGGRSGIPEGMEPCGGGRSGGK